jgi:oligopeptidase A
MENWCIHEKTLLGMSKHVDTGAQLPHELFAKVKAAKTFRAASMMLRQIHFARVDLELHHRYDPSKKGVLDVNRKIARDVLVMQPLDEDRFLMGFTHIFAGGYAAGYYSYKWAEVLSADAFSAFEDAGLDDSAKLAEVGHKFRDTVLALGGSVHPLDVFRSFRGRDPSTAALLRHAGLAPAATPATL